jgi:hypothetical protein
LRYKLLALKKNKWIAPVDDELVDHLYDVFAGKIRFVMDSITTLVTRLPEGSPVRCRRVALVRCCSNSHGNEFALS